MHIAVVSYLDGNYKFLPSIDLEKFYGQLIKKLEMEGYRFLGTL